MKLICDYGCGREAKFLFKNGKRCCCNHTSSCPGIRKKMQENQPMRGKHCSIETKKRMSISQTGKNNPIYGKHHSKEHKKKIGDMLRTPFIKIEEYVKDTNYILLSKEEDYKNQFSKLRFKCPKNHEFEMRWDHFITGQRCSLCKHEADRKRMLDGQASYMNSFITNPSKPQVELFKLTSSIYPASILNCPSLNFSIDIAIPELMIAIEYDGSYWHQNQEADDRRQKLLEKEGWKFLRYRDYIPTKDELEKDILFKTQNIKRKFL